MSGIIVTLYVGSGCGFSTIARDRICQVATEFNGIVVRVRDRSDASADGASVPVTPALLLPGGRRLTGTPSAERLRRVFAELVGKVARVPNKVWYLQRNRLFHGVPLKEIEKYAHLFHEQDFKTKEIVFSEGDLGDAIYLLKTGHVRLYRLTEDGKELSLAILGPGDVFGELALFEESRRQTFAEALQDSHICAASVDDFTRLMSHKPQLTMMVASEIAKRRSEMETRIAGLAYGSVRSKLLHALRHLAREHGERLAGGRIRIAVRLSHQEVAQLIGVSREACTIELGKLQKSGALGFDDARFIVVSPDRLEPGIFDRVLHSVLGAT
jgi:CRP/FNR family cyclic AMP-dependent transcriptional regulator